MFWKNARQRFSGITDNDEDIKKYLKVADSIQKDGYEGVFGFIQDVGHRFVADFTARGRTLDIGFGTGRQALYFKGSPDDYYPLDINEKFKKGELWGRFKNAAVADARRIPFEDNFFDNVVTVYSLEHINDTGTVLKEIRRVLRPDGRILVALPCEGGLLWNVGRELTTKRLFSKRYAINYDKAIAYEHKHDLRSIKSSLEMTFEKRKERFFPFLIPSADVNLIYCAVFVNKK